MLQLGQEHLDLHDVVELGGQGQRGGARTYRVRRLWVQGLRFTVLGSGISV
jgi:hypothetical protein